MNSIVCLSTDILILLCDQSRVAIKSLIIKQSVQFLFMVCPRLLYYIGRISQWGDFDAEFNQVQTV